jgi:hypothetical protein
MSSATAMPRITKDISFSSNFTAEFSLAKYNFAEKRLSGSVLLL